MKSASGDLITLLATSSQFVMVDTYTFTLADGTVLTWTSGDSTNGFEVSSNELQANLET